MPEPQNHQLLTTRYIMDNFGHNLVLHLRIHSFYQYKFAVTSTQSKLSGFFL